MPGDDRKGVEKIIWISKCCLPQPDPHIFTWKRQLLVFTSDIKHIPSRSIVATFSPLGLKSRLAMLSRCEYL